MEVADMQDTRLTRTGTKKDRTKLGGLSTEQFGKVRPQVASRNARLPRYLLDEVRVDLASTRFPSGYRRHRYAQPRGQSDLRERRIMLEPIGRKRMPCSHAPQLPYWKLSRKPVCYQGRRRRNIVWVLPFWQCVPGLGHEPRLDYFSRNGEIISV